MIAGRRDGALLRQLRTLYNIGTIRELTVGQLLERFATDADEVAELAFAALVERHDAMVWRVCLAITRDEHQAEDAFQATFLVLVRKARSLWVRDSLGPWLHQVACRTASCLRTAALRRRKHERRCAERAAACRVETGTPRDPDRDAAIHEELDRLPEKYRAPVVLCDLEGRTHQEAARFLGWPIGTVKTRQFHGRRLIRDRLVRRGLGLAVEAAAVESSRKTAAAMPAEAARSAVIAAMRQSGRLMTGVEVSAQVLTLTRGVLQAMFWNNIRCLAVVALVVGFASGGASVYVLGSQDAGSKNGKAASKPTTSSSTSTSRPKGSKNATGPHAVDQPRSRLWAQQLATRKARASYEIARLTRELAEIAVEEYLELRFPRELAAVGAEINSAESDLIRSTERTDWAQRMFKKGYVSQATKVSEELSLNKSRFALEQVQSKRKILVEYTRSKTAKELRTAVAKARLDELDRLTTWEQEKIRETELESRLRPAAN